MHRDRVAPKYSKLTARSPKLKMIQLSYRQPIQEDKRGTKKKTIDAKGTERATYIPEKRLDMMGEKRRGVGDAEQQCKEAA